MESKIAEQILDELAPAFEAIETQSAALMQFVKEKGIATDEQLAPYLEQAAAASSVRWRALRVRMGRLFSMAEKSDDETRKKEKTEVKAAKGTQADNQAADTKGDAKKDQPDHKPGSAGSSAQAGADRQDIEERPIAKPEAAKSSDVKEAAQKEPAGSSRSGEAQPSPGESDAHEKKDAA